MKEFDGRSISISERAVDTGLPVTALDNMPKSYARKWSGDDCASFRFSGPRLNGRAWQAVRDIIAASTGSSVTPRNQLPPSLMNYRTPPF